LKTIDLDKCLVQGADLLEKVGGLHKFMKWKNALLTVVVFQFFITVVVLHVTMYYECICLFDCLIVLLGMLSAETEVDKTIIIYPCTPKTFDLKSAQELSSCHITFSPCFIYKVTHPFGIYNFSKTFNGTAWKL
jgi:hypothetical protein